MKKLSIIFLTLLSAALLLQKPAFAASTTATQSGTVTTSATIRGNTFTISGFTSPFASVVVTASSQFIVSTTADAQGNFSAPVTIALNTTNLCLDTVDFKRLGSSQTCINTATTNPIGLFLPPTIGLLSTTVDAGQNATIYGYSLPRSSVIINPQNLPENQTYTVTTDETGYYSYTVESVPAGTFVFSAVGEVLGAQSLPPTGGVELKALSLFEQASTTAQDLTQSLASSIPASYLTPILLTILFLIICILVFLYIKKRKKKEIKKTVVGRK